MFSLLSVIPLLLMFCTCGGVAGAGNFKAFPFDHKQQLITYHTEGQGEDKVRCGAAFCFVSSLLKSIMIVENRD